MPTFTVDATGVQVPSLTEALADVRRQLAEIFGDDLSNADQTPQGQIAGVLAVSEAEIGEALVNTGNAVDADRAQGAQLDTLGALLQIERRLATRSRVTATLTGVAGTNVPAGSRAKTAADAEFRTVAAAVLAPTPGVSVEMEAVETGAVEAAAGALTTIVTVIPGWETITNASAAVVGRVRQDDPSYRRSRAVRTAQRSVGPLDALKAALEEAEAGRTNPKENNTDAAVVIQEWSIRAHHLLVIAESGTDGDIRRAVENHRGMGVGTMTAISGGAPDNAALDSVSNGTVTWNSTDYTGLDLTSATTGAQKAAALTTLLAMDAIAPTVSFVDGRYLAQFPWHPDRNPVFGSATVENAFALDPDNAVAAPGPYVRPRKRQLTITLTVTRGDSFPAAGLNQIRSRVHAVVTAYGLGQQVWSNDILVAAESVPGTRVTAIVVESNSVSVSGQPTPLDSLWELADSALTVTIS